MSPSPDDLIRYHTVGDLIDALSRFPRETWVAVPGFDPSGLGNSWMVETLGHARLMRLWFEPADPDDRWTTGYFVTPHVHQSSGEEIGWVPVSVLVLAPDPEQLDWWASEDSDWDVVQERRRNDPDAEGGETEGGVS